MSKRRERLHDRTAAVDAFMVYNASMNAKRTTFAVKRYGIIDNRAITLSNGQGIATDGYQHGSDCDCHK